MRFNHQKECCSLSAFFHVKDRRSASDRSVWILDLQLAKLYDLGWVSVFTSVKRKVFVLNCIYLSKYLPHGDIMIIWTHTCKELHMVLSQNMHKILIPVIICFMQIFWTKELLPFTSETYTEYKHTWFFFL